MKRTAADDTQTQAEPMISTETGAQQAEERAEVRSKRGAEVRRKYDFSVIRMLRHEKGLTIEKFAKVCGLSYAPISRIETNLIKPNLDTLDKIAAGLGITTHALVSLAEKRDVEAQTAPEAKLGGFSFHTVVFGAVEVSAASGKKGATATAPETRTSKAATIVVRAGKLQLKLNDKLHTLGPGDALNFEHSFARTLTALEDVEFAVTVHPR